MEWNAGKLKWRTPFSGGTVPEDFLETPLILQLKFAGISLEYHLLNREFQSFDFDNSDWDSTSPGQKKDNDETKPGVFIWDGIMMGIHLF